MSKRPKVLFYVYPTAFQAPGGGEVQLLQTKKYLEQLGVSIKLFDPWQDKLKDFDILHTFGSVKDCLPVMEAAHTQGIKNVLSTICWYSWKSAWHTYTDPKRRFLSMIRHGAKSFFPFLPSERKQMMRISDLLLPNSQSEADQLAGYFNIPRNKIIPVPNGVDLSFSQASPENFIQKYGFKDFVLCVGRIEPRKNQLNMVRALKGLKVPVVFVGQPVPHYQSYFEQCEKEADANIHFLGALPHESGLLASAYAACHTFVLASWLETPGLAALEAGLAGANVVITSEGATKEYFGSFALYAAPDKLSDIRNKVESSLGVPKSKLLQQHIQNNYPWIKVAEQTLRAYQSLWSNR